MNQTERQIEFTSIREIWRELALTDLAKERIDSTVPFLAETELKAAMRDTTESRIMLEKLGTPPLTALEGIREIMTVAARGDCLTAAQLEQAELALVAVKRLKEYLNRGKQLELSLPWYSENLEELEDVREAIHVQIRGGRVDDFASKLLHSLRAEITRTEEKMREKADSIIRNNKECMSDSFCVTRNGHLCVPVKKEYKFKINGSVIDKSSTGSTFFIEPTAVAKYCEELQLLRIDEENEERRILYALSVMLGNQSEAMEQNLKTIEKLDYCFSKGKLSMELQCVEPKINTDRIIRLKGARHPLMDKNVCVSQDFHMGESYRGVVITGPNTGGKTVALKTVALSCMMAQCGLHVCCEEADICMNSNYLCDIGDGQNLSQNLSTFSAHITNVLDILQRVNRESLVIMDELGSGTDPTEGMGIAIAIMEELRKSECLFLITTHYPEIKNYADQTAGIMNARMTFDKESLRPLYKMVIGEAGESCAFYIAAKLGMPKYMLQVAVEAAYGNEASLVSGEKQRNDVQKSRAVPEDFFREDSADRMQKKTSGPRIKKKKASSKNAGLADKYHRGDSVMIYPDKKIGIVCEPVNEDGVLRVQLQKKKIWINHKRVKLLVAATELYPEDYDFSIVFDTVEARKLRHQMSRKYVEGEELHLEEE